MRRVIVAGVVVTALAAHAAPAAAERRRNTLGKDVCVLALMLWDDHRLEVAPLVGTTVGGGAWDHVGVGGAARYGVTENVVVGVEARRQVALAREPAAMLDTPARAGAASLALGYRVATGKLRHPWPAVSRLDLVASIGPGVVWSSDATHPAVALDATLRVFVTDGITVELGVHDDIVVEVARGSAAARTVDAADRAALPRHAIEARAGIGVWWPSRPHRRCKRICR
jgi:hypothetical protein